nr:PRD domain-containing protein [Tatumella sp. JGM130]
MLFEQLQNEVLPPDELARRLTVSTRTLRTDITCLNQLLADYGARCRLIRGAGYQLQITDKTRFSQLPQSTRPDNVPRSPAARVHYLLHRFLTASGAVKLEELADECFISRATLQSEMAEVRQTFHRYRLTIENRPRYGMKLFGSERALRHCLTDFYCQQIQPDNAITLFSPEINPALPDILHQSFSRYNIRMSDNNVLYLQLYCSISLQRLKAGYRLDDFTADDMAPEVRHAARQIIRQLLPGGSEVPEAEETCLGINIAARRHGEDTVSLWFPDESLRLMNAILSYIGRHYNFDLCHDTQLCSDLLAHIRTMLTRVRYQITIPNPLLSNIKQYYPMAYDMTLAAVSECAGKMHYPISENEIGFLVLHIGVGLERLSPSGKQYQPQVLVVCNTGQSTIRVIEALLLRRYPQIMIKKTVTLREYQQQSVIEEDFVISTVRLSTKNKPVVVMSPFPSEYQWEMIGRQVFTDRTWPRMLERFFDARHFMILSQPLTRAELFRRVCDQLQQEDIVDEHFYASVSEREQIVSTLLGEGIALPHAIGLQAKKTVVYTLLAPDGVPWGEERAYVIFLLAISKTEYAEIMALYELFVALMCRKSALLLRHCKNFSDFTLTTLQCLHQSVTEH